MSENKNEVKLLESRWVTPTVEAFRWERPDGFEYLPGQYTRIFIGDEKRAFSIVSSPDEEYLEIASIVKSRSSFKDELDDLGMGDSIHLGPILGELVYKEGDDDLGFLTGGIGVTPFISMLRYISKNAPDTRLVMFYSAKKEEEIAFAEELEAYSKSLKNFKLIVTLTDADWEGETGRIDEAMIRRHVSDPDSYSWRIAGPPKMVESMKSLLTKEMRLESVESENFNGY